jgi:hypothetical protein
MTELLKKEKKINWTESCEKSFQELKRRLTKAPLLTLPDIQWISSSIAMPPDKG